MKYYDAWENYDMNHYADIGLAIDLAADTGNLLKLNELVCAIDALLGQEGQDKAVLFYFRANAYSALRTTAPNFQEIQFDWEQPELTKEIISLREAIRSSEFAALDIVRRCQVLTNLGNALDAVGRPIDALAAWDEALQTEPKFAMALANRATGLTSYSAAFYDPGHQCVFLAEAAKGFEFALATDAIWDSEYPDSVLERLEAKHQHVRAYLAVNCDLAGFDPDQYELGDTSDARAFNRWRLQHRLFLNPLNDIGAHSIAAQDVFHLPNHTYAFEEAVIFPRYFDLLKQEYVAACTLLFEGLEGDRVYTADQTLLGFEHADYAINSVQTEKQKAAFRMAYSLLDKCAVFINDYFKLGHDPRSLSTSFRNVWYSGRGAKRVLHPNLPIKNWRLRGLYSLSLDLYENDFRETASPLAHQACDVRNAAEHRFVSVHEMLLHTDDIGACLALSASDLESQALRMLRLARSAIIGLSLAVQHQEEHLKENASDLVMPILAIPKDPR